jgi:hypothetical protein
MPGEAAPLWERKAMSVDAASIKPEQVRSPADRHQAGIRIGG